MSEYFSFALMQKKGTKRKNQGCTYGATPAASPAKGQELAPLKQHPPYLHQWKKQHMPFPELKEEE